MAIPKCYITKPISVASGAHAREDVTQPPGGHLNKQTKTQSWVRAILMEAHDGNKMALQIAAGGLGHLRVLTSNTTWRETAQEAGRKVERNVSTVDPGVAMTHMLTRRGGDSLW